MANVYTVLLGELPVGSGSPATLVPSPPAGYRYVITDIEADNQLTPSPTPPGGFTLRDSAGVTVWRVSLFAIFLTAYHWRGRQVVDVGDSITFESGDGQWTIRATGFQLALP